MSANPYQACVTCGRSCSCGHQHGHHHEHLPDAITDLLWFFEYHHLTGDLRKASAQCHDLAWEMAHHCKNHRETVHGLRKLLEAKDCFIRARL